MRRIQAAVKKAGMTVVLGYSEREGASLYISQAFISPDGKILLNRRKIKPTHAERTIFGEGQAESLKTVVDTPVGKVGGLNCWEHLQPLLRYYEYTQGVQIHVSSWPPIFGMPNPDEIEWLYHETGEANNRISQVMAIEGASFVMVCSQIITEKNLEKNLLVGNLVTRAVCGVLLPVVSLILIVLNKTVAWWRFLYDLWARRNASL
jgi:predicted amidohydrolase